MKKPRSFLLRLGTLKTAFKVALTITFAAAMSVLPAWADAVLRPEIRAALPEATLMGSARLTFWGLEVYQAHLWTAPGLRAQDYAQHAFALELEYLRDLSGKAIAKRSIQEMRRVGKFSDEQAER